MNWQMLLQQSSTSEAGLVQITIKKIQQTCGKIIGYIYCHVPVLLFLKRPVTSDHTYIANPFTSPRRGWMKKHAGYPASTYCSHTGAHTLSRPQHQGRYMYWNISCRLFKCMYEQNCLIGSFFNRLFKQLNLIHDQQIIISHQIFRSCVVVLAMKPSALHLESKQWEK